MTGSFRHFRLRLLAAALLALLLLAGGAASAQNASLESAKAAGWVGERPDGYLGLVREDAPADLRELVASVNTRRADSYDRIARANGTTPVVVAALSGRKLVERTPSGRYVMDAGGRWVQKS